MQLEQIIFSLILVSPNQTCVWGKGWRKGWGVSKDSSIQQNLKVSKALSKSPAGHVPAQNLIAILTSEWIVVIQDF